MTEAHAGQPEAPEESSYADSLLLAGRLTDPAIRQAIRELALPAGSAGLDAACGVGRHTLWLAAATDGTGSRVTGVDLSSEHLAVARELTRGSPQAGQVEYTHGNLLRLPFADDSFDWAWCADALWPVPGMDQVAAVAELRRVVRPGGRVAVLFWSSQTLLPGYPALETRLAAAHARHNRYLRDGLPEEHSLRACSWFRSAGLESCQVKSFVAEARAPLQPELRDAVAFCCSMFWSELESEVSQEDWCEYQRLCDPSSPDFLPDQPDYYAFLTYTLFHATVPAARD